MKELASVLAVVGYGSNLGNRELHIEQALQRLQEGPAVRVRKRSRTLETEPVGGPPQPDYLNGAVLVDTTLPPTELLNGLHEIERQGGRVREQRNGPRTIDLDLLLYSDRVSDHKSCRVPHPHLHERGFVLEPLAELVPDWIHPRFQVSIAQLYRDWQARTQTA